MGKIVLRRLLKTIVMHFTIQYTIFTSKKYFIKDAECGGPTPSFSVFLFVGGGYP
jgi:hypothetical protein